MLAQGDGMARSGQRNLGMCTLVASVFLLPACSSQGGSRSTAAPSSTPTMTPISARHYAINDLVTFGNTWQIRLTGFRVLGPGDSANVQVVGIDMTVKNLATQPSRLDDSYLLSFRDTRGLPHAIGEQTGICQLSTGEKQCLDALTLAAGAERSGDIGAIGLVSTTQFTLTLDSIAQPGVAHEVIWDLSLH